MGMQHIPVASKSLVFRISSYSVVKITHKSWRIFTGLILPPSSIWFGLVQSSITYTPTVSLVEGTPRSKPDFFCFSYFPEVATHLVNDYITFISLEFFSFSFYQTLLYNLKGLSHELYWAFGDIN